jgi:hypothetical protein
MYCRRVRIALAVGCALWVSLVPASIAQTRKVSDRIKRLLPEPQMEPRARQLLQQMADAYNRLPALEQRTVFSAALIPFTPGKNPFETPERPHNTPAPPPESNDERSLFAPGKPGVEETRLDRTLLLRFSRPNRLFLELNEGKSTPSTSYQWVSDGKFFYSYIPDKNWYTREKSPGRLSDFRRLTHLNSNSLEVQMLIGNNPFGDLRGQADSVRYEGPALVREIETEVVVLRNQGRFEDTVVRLYIGKEDFMLRRVITETIPVVGPSQPGKVGDALDALIDSATPPQPVQEGEEEPSAAPAAPLAMITRLTYDNLLDVKPNFDFRTFVFQIPNGAMLYGPPPSAAQRKRTMLETLKALQRRYAAEVLPQRPR